jgi:DNA polymerase-3 subunit alpha
MAANLSAVMDDTDKVHVLFEDAKANGLTILPPDVNASEYRFVPVDARTIRYGLGGIKGTGETAIAKIIEARAQGGPFRDLVELCARTDKRLVNRRVIESLVRAGAFDAIDPQRSRLFATVGRAIDAAEQAERNAQQASLFGGGGAEERLVGELVPARPWDIRETLKEEKAALGFWLSDHLFNYFRGELRSFARTPLGKLVASNDYGEQRTQILAGIVESVRWTKTASGRMLIVMLSDDSGRVEITVYSEVLEQHRDVVKEDAPLVVEAKVRQIRRSGGDEGEETFLRVTAERLYDLAAARGRFARGLRLSIKGEAAPPGAEGPPPALTRLRALLTPHRNGPLPVQIRYSNGRAECELRLGDEWRVTPNELLIQQLEDWLKRENVEVVY